MSADKTKQAVGENLRPLYVYNGGFLTNKRVRKILSLAGYQIKLGKPTDDNDLVGIWGNSPTAHRGKAVAARTDTPLVRVEDPFLRSVLTGRDGASPMGLQIDHSGVHFDPSTVSDLEQLLRDHPLDDTALLTRAKEAIAGLQRDHLSKYNAFDPQTPAPDPGYVIVVDQTRGDASVTASGADTNTFREMLYYAQTEHPKARILIKTHPETSAGHRAGYFSEADCTTDRITLYDTPISPYALFDGAVAIYTVSSQLGFEALLTGHRPVVFGQPFYMGWGLTDDRQPLTRRRRKLTRNQLFAGAMLLYPKWYDPFTDQLCSYEVAVRNLTAQAREWREDHAGWSAFGMRLWKRKPLQQFFGRYSPVAFGNAKGARRKMIWASKATNAVEPFTRIEDGFLRSRGLGADLTPPMSLVLDDLGIYYDPNHPSRLEEQIANSVHLSEAQRARAKALQSKIVAAGISKYNLSNRSEISTLPHGHRILVPGQVEDDASIRQGASNVRTNLDLLRAARAANPDAVLIYKPHPDVETGLRQGAITDPLNIADVVLEDTNPITALDAVDEVWTMTSLLGFEALIRGKIVTCLGTPFYAGWGLTQDHGDVPLRRNARPDLTALIHAAFIDYPRYFDPKTGLACPAEVVVDRLNSGDIPQPRSTNQLLAKLQGIFASYAHLWR